MVDSEITVFKVLELDIENLRSVGISYNKAAYIKNIAQAVADGNLTLDVSTI